MVSTVLKIRLAVMALLLAMASPAVIAQNLPGLPDSGQEAGGEESEAPPAAEEARPEPAAIPAAQVPVQADQSQALLRQAVAVSEPVAEEEAIGPKLPAMTEQIRRMQADTRLKQLDSLGFRPLENLEAQWQRVQSQLQSWQQQLTRRSESLAQWQLRAADQVKSWDLTVDALRAASVSDALVQTARNTREAWKDAEQQLKARQDEVLTVQSQLTAQFQVTDEVLQSIDEVKASARRGVLRRDHPPLWRGLAPSDGTDELPGVTDRLRSDWQNARDYFRGQESSVALFLLLALITLGIFLYVRKRVIRLADQQPDVQRHLQIFRRPAGAALVVVLMLAPWVFPGTPGPVRDILGLIALIPMVWLLPLITPASMRRPIYAVAALYLLVRFTDLVSSGTAAGRLVLLLYTVLAGVLAWWIFRPGGRASTVEGGGWWRAAQRMGQLAAIALVASAVFNVLGFVALADLLAEGTLRSIFLALLIFLGVAVTEGIVVTLLQSKALQWLNMVRWNSASIIQWVMRLVQLAGAVTWLLGTLSYFRILDPAKDMATAVLTASAKVGSVGISLGNILGFVLALVVGVLLARLLRFVLTVEVFPRITLPRGVPATIVMLANYAVLGVAFVLALAAAGIELSQFALIAGALSVGIGFGLQNVVNNFVSGLILAFERPVQAGDVVQFGETWGRISRIGVRSSTVRTWSGAEVIVPNGDLISSQVTNWTLSDQQRRVEIPAGVAYGSNPHQVIELLVECARKEPRLLPTPEPYALFLGFGASSLDFELRAWTDDFDNFLSIKSDLTLAIHDALYAAGIEIPFPQQDLHLRTVDEGAAMRLAGRGLPAPQSPGSAGAPGGSGDTDVASGGTSPGSGDDSASSGTGEGGTGRGSG